MKKQLIILIVVVLLIIVGSLLFIFLHENNVYQDNELGFKLILPKGWIIDDDGAETKYTPLIYYPLENETHTLRILVHLDKNPLGISLSDIVNITIGLYTNNNDSTFTIVSHNPRTINSMDAYELNITGRYDVNDSLTKGKILHITNNEKVFDIYCEGTPYFIFDENIENIELIINSFEII